jgi:hypothetical protein
MPQCLVAIGKQFNLHSLVLNPLRPGQGGSQILNQILSSYSIGAEKVCISLDGYMIVKST